MRGGNFFHFLFPALSLIIEQYHTRNRYLNQSIQYMHNAFWCMEMNKSKKKICNNLLSKSGTFTLMK